MTDVADFQRQQLALAKVIRCNHGEVAGIEARRVKVYQDLFFNNVEGFCAAAFPVFKSLLSQPDWLALVRSFFVEHTCETPHFCEIAQEFLEFLFEYQADSLPYPYMLELAHYEWAELACSVAITQQSELSKSSDVDLESSVTVPDSVMPLTYQYPVHTVSPETAKTIEPTPTSVIVYRDAQFHVQFMLVDALSVLTLQLIQQHGSVTIASLIAELNQLNRNLTTEQLQTYMSQAMKQFVHLGIVVQDKISTRSN